MKCGTLTLKEKPKCKVIFYLQKQYRDQLGAEHYQIGKSINAQGNETTGNCNTRVNFDFVGTKIRIQKKKMQTMHSKTRRNFAHSNNKT